MKNYTKTWMGWAAAGLLALGISQAQAQTPVYIVETVTNNITTEIQWKYQSLLEVARTYADGTVSGSTNGWYDESALASLEAVVGNPAAKVFSHWTGQTNTTVNPLVLPMTQAWTNVVPVFVLREYTWTINKGLAQAVVVPGTTNWPYGTTATNILQNPVIDLGNGRRAVYHGHTTQPTP